MNQINSSAFRHALVVSGGSPEQRAQTALQIARTRLCAAGGDRPCELCIHCRKTAAGIHPDLSCIQPSGGQIRVDDIRAMRAAAFILPGDAQVRVFIIEDADLMNEQAQNAALKILEEPPDHAVFILTTALPDALRPTVRSRCGLLRLPPAPEAPPVDNALRLMETLARRDRLALARFCRELEALPRDEFPRLLRDSCGLLSQALHHKLASEPCAPMAAELAHRFSAKALTALIRALEQISRYYENNGGPGHLAGLVNAYCWEATHID